MLQDPEPSQTHSTPQPNPADSHILGNPNREMQDCMHAEYEGKGSGWTVPRSENILWQRAVADVRSAPGLAPHANWGICYSSP